MDLKQMQYFLCLAQEGNATRAARQLNIVQPASKEDLWIDRRTPGRPRSLGPKLQRGKAASGPMVLRQDADADLP